MQLSNRMVKADFWTDSDLIQKLPPAGRLLYEGLWQLSEASGVIEDDPLSYKMQLFPGDSDITVEDVEDWTGTLEEMGKLVPFERDGKAYFYVANFHQHQELRRPGKPELPLPDWVVYVENEKKRRAGAYIIDYQKMPGTRRETIKIIGTLSNGLQEKAESPRELRESLYKVSSNCHKDESECEGESEKESENKTSVEDGKAAPDESPDPDLIKFDSDSTEYRLASKLREKVANWYDPKPSNLPDPNVEDMQKWCQDIDRLIRIGPVGGTEGEDGLDPEQVDYMIEWIWSESDFWRNTVKSPIGLRKNLVDIVAKIKEYRRHKGKKQKYDGKTEEEYMRKITGDDGPEPVTVEAGG